MLFIFIPHLLTIFSLFNFSCEFNRKINICLGHITLWNKYLKISLNYKKLSGKVIELCFVSIRSLNLELFSYKITQPICRKEKLTLPP